MPEKSSLLQRLPQLNGEHGGVICIEPSMTNHLSAIFVARKQNPAAGVAIRGPTDDSKQLRCPLELAKMGTNLLLLLPQQH